ncbi:MAG: HNH endonuclease [Saprospiraceae bacterium]
MALTTPDGQRINVSQKDLLGDGKDGRMKMEGKDGGGRKKPAKVTKIDAVKNLMTKSPDWIKTNEELMKKLVGKSESFIAKVDGFYGVTMKKTTPVGFKGAGTYNGVEYNKYGFPLLKDKNPFGNNYIFKNAKGNHTTDFTDAQEWLRKNKDNLGFDDVFVVPGGTRFQVKINGKWSEKMTWHHHENGTDMIPVPSRIHNPELVHSGGVKTVQLGINHLFDY